MDRLSAKVASPPTPRRYRAPLDRGCLFEAVLALAKKENVSMQIALVSMDTTRDTPKRLHEFRSEQKLSEDDWTLLSGADADVRTLSVALGYSYQKVEGSEEIMHSNRLALLNQVGEIQHIFEGLNQSPEEIIAQIKALETPAGADS